MPRQLPYEIVKHIEGYVPTCLKCKQTNINWSFREYYICITMSNNLYSNHDMSEIMEGYPNVQTYNINLGNIDSRIHYNFLHGDYWGDDDQDDDEFFDEQSFVRIRDCTLEVFEDGLCHLCILDLVMSLMWCAGLVWERCGEYTNLSINNAHLTCMFNIEKDMKIERFVAMGIDMVNQTTDVFHTMER